MARLGLTLAALAGSAGGAAAFVGQGAPRLAGRAVAPSWARAERPAGGAPGAEDAAEGAPAGRRRLLVGAALGLALGLAGAAAPSGAKIIRTREGYEFDTEKWATMTKQEKYNEGKKIFKLEAREKDFPKKYSVPTTAWPGQVAPGVYKADVNCNDPQDRAKYCATPPTKAEKEAKKQRALANPLVQDKIKERAGKKAFSMFMDTGMYKARA